MQAHTKSLAAAVALTLTLAASSSLGAPAEGQSGEGVADFTWAMPDRFGHYTSGERLLKYPQSAREVDSGPFEVFFRLPAPACEQGVDRHWAVGGSEVEAERTGPRCAFRLSFDREGAYEVELKVEGNGHDDTSTQRVNVQDLLIVAIGDSVASGEGNPDNGNLINPTWQNRRCHRSSFASFSRAAALAEAADLKSSVTFVHLACSGATVPRGLVGRFRGAQAGPFPRPRLLPAQLDELEAIARDREVDAVLLSVGGNDVGFAKIVSFCITHRRCQRKPIKLKRLDVPGGSKQPLDEAVKASLGQLRDRFARVNRKLPDGLSRDRVFALEYFDPTHATSDLYCDRILVRVDREELEWAHRSVIVHLIMQVRDAAKRHHWQYVPGVADAFAGHGYCAGSESWVRRLAKSLRQQGLLNFKGTLHPNEEGHVQTANLIDRVLRRELFRDGIARESRSPEEQDDQFLGAGVVPGELAVNGTNGDSDWVAWALGGAGAVAVAAAASIVALWRRRPNGAGRPGETGERDEREKQDSPPDDWSRAWKRGRWVAGAALVGLAGLAATGELDAAAAGVAATLGLVALALVGMRRDTVREIAARLQRASIGGVSFELAARDAAVAASESRIVDGLDNEEALLPTDLFHLRILLEAKMAYIGKSLLATPIRLDGEPGSDEKGRLPSQIPTYLTLGSLRYDGLISNAQLLTADRLLNITARFPEDRSAASERFFREAKTMVGGLRATVFYNEVRRQFREAGWMRLTKDAPDPPLDNERPALLYQKNGSCLLVVPVLAIPGSPATVDRARKRLEEQGRPPNVQRRLIVIPNQGRPEDVTTDDHADPMVIKLHQLDKILRS